MNDNLELVSLNRAAEMTSLSRSMVNKLRADDRFCRPVALGDKRIAFVKSEVIQWIADKIALRNA